MSRQNYPVKQKPRPSVEQRAARFARRERRDFGQAPAGYIRGPRGLINNGSAQPLRLVHPDSTEAKLIPKRKITKVSVETAIEGFEGNYLGEPNEEGDGVPRGQVFAPNIGTPFHGVKFLTDPNIILQVTEDDLQAALYILRDGGSITDACDIIGASISYLHKLADANPLWNAAMRRAIAIGKMFLIRRVRNGDAHWQAAAWMLARKHRSEFGEQVQDQEESKVIRVRPVIKREPETLPPAGMNEQELLAAVDQETVKLLENAAVAQGAQLDPIPDMGTVPVENSESLGQTNITNGVDKVIDTDGSVISVGSRRTRKKKVPHA